VVSTEVTMAGWRDASVIRSHGRARRYHIAVAEDEGNWFAACAPGRHLRGQRCRPIDPPSLTPAHTVSTNLRCQHPGCRALWPTTDERSVR